MRQPPLPDSSAACDPSPGAFPLTNWSEVARAAAADEATALAALNRLVQRYWHPLEGHLRRKFQVTPEEAEDLLQSFLLVKVVRDRLIRHAQRSRGRFRTFLLNTLDNFVVSESRKAQARKRAPVGGTLAVQAAGDDLVDPNRPGEQDAFDLDWLRVVIATTLSRMEAQCRAKGQQRHWAVFKARVLDPTLEGTPALPYSILVEQFAFASPSEASNTLTTALRTFRRVLGEVIREYERDAHAAKAELEALKAALDRFTRRNDTEAA